MSLKKCKLIKDHGLGKAGTLFKYRINRKHGTYMIHLINGQERDYGFEEKVFNEYFEKLEMNAQLKERR